MEKKWAQGDLICVYAYLTREGRSGEVKKIQPYYMVFSEMTRDNVHKLKHRK